MAKNDCGFVLRLTSQPWQHTVFILQSLQVLLKWFIVRSCIQKKPAGYSFMLNSIVIILTENIYIYITFHFCITAFILNKLKANKNKNRLSYIFASRAVDRGFRAALQHFIIILFCHRYFKLFWVIVQPYSKFAIHNFRLKVRCRLLGKTCLIRRERPAFADLKKMYVCLDKLNKHLSDLKAQHNFTPFYCLSLADHATFLSCV